MVSPWPGAMVIRRFFEFGGARINAELVPFVQDKSFSLRSDMRYGAHQDELFDIYLPETVSDDIPTVVWFHGGAWVSGAKDQTENFYKIMANDGFAVVSVNYSLAPEHHYPKPVLQGIAALEFLAEHAQSFGIRSRRFVLAGDSAGAQIAAQLAVISSNPRYRTKSGFNMRLENYRVDGTILFCGALDGALIIPEDQHHGKGLFDIILWAYAGTHNYRHIMEEASPALHLDSEFPRTFISAGNADPLAPMSYEFQSRLEQFGIEHTALFYADDHPTPLPHEYQFEFQKFQEARDAYNKMKLFLHSFSSEE